MFTIIAALVMFCLAFAIGITGSKQFEKSLGSETRDVRSCQVKQIDKDGRAVWMTCAEWKSANGY